ncbi:hypothetical protein E4U53_006989 [Claviceps sorghi]|nr:hypothetical protein E4U53_006989 [Claviceps sorghi]
MQFSASAALAAIAIYAGQAVADCSPISYPFSAALDYCDSPTAGTWYCSRTPATIHGAQGKYNVKVGDTGVSLVASCDLELTSFASIYCTAKSDGSFDLKCPQDKVSILIALHIV